MDSVLIDKSRDGDVRVFVVDMGRSCKLARNDGGGVEMLMTSSSSDSDQCFKELPKDSTTGTCIPRTHLDYCPPEELMMSHPERTTKKGDIWSVGVMLLKATFGMSCQTITAGRAVPIPVHSNARLRELLAQLLVVDPVSRPAAAEANSHGFFTHFNQKEIFTETAKFELLQIQLARIQRVHDDIWPIRLRRESVVKDVLQAFKQCDRRELLMEIDVRFVGEPGLDLGGLKKDMVNSFFESVVQPSVGLFETASSTGDSTCALPKPTCTSERQLRDLEAVGKLLLKVYGFGAGERGGAFLFLLFV
jgi:serine/threonine protein kinase